MEITLLWPSDKDKLCRTCISLINEPPTPQNSLYFKNKPTKLFTLFHNLITPEISPDDGLPNLLCIKCRKQLQLWMTFKKQCLKANESLKELLSIEETFSESEIEVLQDDNCCTEYYSNEAEMYNDFNHIPLHNNDNTSSEVYVQSIGDNFLTNDENELEIKSIITTESLTKLECDDDVICEEETVENNSLTTDENEPEIKSIITIDETLIKSEYDEQQPIIYEEQKNNKQYQCNICNRVLENKLVFTNHFMQHAVLAGVSKEHFYFCKHCGEVFKSQLELEEHTVNEHANDTDVLWECSQCQETFDSENYLFKHETDEDHYNLLHESSKDIFTCPMCSESCATKNKLISHSVVHLLQNYQCKICSKLFITQVSHNWHMNNHPNSGIFCKICNKHFANIDSLQVHVRLVHRKTSNYECRFCSKTFKTQRIAKVHEDRHHTEKRFMCHSCGYRTNSSGCLNIHMRIHTAERPYKCTYANCAKAFISSGKRSEHVRSHLNVRPHKCQICSKSFMESSTLKRHLLVHSDDRPYKCFVCPYTTKKRYHLLTHLKKHEKS